MNETLGELKTYEQHKHNNNDSVSLHKSLSNLDKTQSEVLVEIKQLLSRLQKDPHMAQAESLVTQLNKVLKELNEKTKSFFSNK